MNENLSKAVFFIFILVIMRRVMVSGHLLAQEVGLRAKQHRDGNASNCQQQVLNARLSIVHGLIDTSGRQGNVDQGGNKVGRLASIARTTHVQWAFISELIIALAHISPRGAGAITSSVAISPYTRLAIYSLLVVSTAPTFRGRVETCGAEHARVPVDGPLHEDENNHVNKQGRCKGNHGKELEHEVKTLAKVHGVNALEASSSEHLQNTKDDGELHLEGVEEEELVGRHVPNRVEAEGVHGVAIAILTRHLRDVTLFGLIAVKRPASPKQVEAEGEAIIVDETGVHGEESHHGNHVTTHVQSPRHLVELGLVILLLVPEKVKTRAEEEQTVSNVAVHDPEQEGESRRREQGGVGLPVPWNTIRVDKLLVPVGELVRRKVRGRRRPRLGHLIHVRRHVVIHVAVGAVHRGADVLEGFRDDPSLSAEHARDVRLEHVEGVVDRLLAEDDPRPAFRVLG
mmetsp:Transcript_328/g.528  ORF Transcript_328/g.528 Transcript_328/m.528 type:complete len:457 (-) Transcript_328:100-1470(-)